MNNVKQLLIKRVQFIFLSVIVVSTPIIHTGCIAIAAVGAGAGAYAYLKGSLDSHLDASIEECLVAVRKGVPRLGLIKVKEISDQETGKFTFRDSLDTKITINLLERQHGVTHVEIRVGRVGDENRSLQVLNAITRQLKKQSTPN